MVDTHTVLEGGFLLASHYRIFDVENRLLMTGHSHQAWPDVAFEGHKQAFIDAAKHVDDKWSLAFKKADRVASLIKRRLDDTDGEIVLGPNTQDLFLRFLSGQNLTEPFTIITTDGEFHSLRRQVSRLEEAGIRLIRVGTYPLESLAERISELLRPSMNALVYVSHVFYETSLIFRGVADLVENCSLMNIPIVVDTYHSLGAIEFSTKKDGLAKAVLIGGGYKYLQLGEGNCFLRLPPGTAFRPIITGWFAEFFDLQKTKQASLGYPVGALAFQGATYDPTSHYRAASVLEFFETQGLSSRVLDQSYKRQLKQMVELLTSAGFPNGHLGFDPDADRAGFLSLQTPNAQMLCNELRKHSVLTDCRGDHLRLGPAPYLSEGQIERSMVFLIELATGSI